MLVLLIRCSAFQVFCLFLFFFAKNQFDWPMTKQKQKKLKLEKLPKIEIFIREDVVLPFDDLYRWEGENFGQIICNKIENY